MIVTQIVNPYVVHLMVLKPATEKKVVVGFQPFSKKLKNIIPLQATGSSNDLGSSVSEVNAGDQTKYDEELEIL